MCIEEFCLNFCCSSSFPFRKQILYLLYKKMGINLPVEKKKKNQSYPKKWGLPSKKIIHLEIEAFDLIIWLTTYPLSVSQDARVRRGEREERPADPRARQEEQSLGREGQVHNHVTRPPRSDNSSNNKKNNNNYNSNSSGGGGGPAPTTSSLSDADDGPHGKKWWISASVRVTQKQRMRTTAAAAAAAAAAQSGGSGSLRAGGSAFFTLFNNRRHAGRELIDGARENDEIVWHTYIYIIYIYKKQKKNKKYIYNEIETGN